MKKIILTETQLLKIINEQVQKNGGIFTNVNDFQKALKNLKKEGYTVNGSKSFDYAYLEFMEQTISKGIPVKSLNIITRSHNVGTTFLQNKSGYPKQQLQISKTTVNGSDIILFYTENR